MTDGLKDINVSVVAGRVDAGPSVCLMDRQTLDGFGVSLTNTHDNSVTADLRAAQIWSAEADGVSP